jgi:hypothetical protein
MSPRVVFLLGLAALACVNPAGAQPAPSFQSGCGELRQAMAGLDRREETELVTIEVAGPLELVHSESGLVYLGLCGPPHPRVLCITYETNGRKVGDRVVVTGSIVPRGPDFIQLDPCLHRLPEAGDKQ